MNEKIKRNGTSNETGSILGLHQITIWLAYFRSTGAPCHAWI